MTHEIVFIPWSPDWDTPAGDIGSLAWSAGVRLRWQWTPPRRTTTSSMRGGSFQSVGLNSLGFILSHFTSSEAWSCQKLIADKINTETDFFLITHLDQLLPLCPCGLTENGIRIIIISLSLKWFFNFEQLLNENVESMRVFWATY